MKSSFWGDTQSKLTVLGKEPTVLCLTFHNVWVLKSIALSKQKLTFKLLNSTAERNKNQNFEMGVLSPWMLINESLEKNLMMTNFYTLFFDYFKVIKILHKFKISRPLLWSSGIYIHHRGFPVVVCSNTGKNL